MKTENATDSAFARCLLCSLRSASRLFYLFRPLRKKMLTSPPDPKRRARMDPVYRILESYILWKVKRVSPVHFKFLVQYITIYTSPHSTLTSRNRIFSVADKQGVLFRAWYIATNFQQNTVALEAINFCSPRTLQELIRPSDINRYAI